jgi:hypothetical protein
LAKTIHRHCTSRNLKQLEGYLQTLLRDYFKYVGFLWLGACCDRPYRELKKIRMKLRSLLKSNPHQVWGLPIHEAFISQSITELDDCDKRIQVRLLMQSSFVILILFRHIWLAIRTTGWHNGTKVDTIPFF